MGSSAVFGGGVGVGNCRGRNNLDAETGLSPVPSLGVVAVTMLAGTFFVDCISPYRERRGLQAYRGIFENRRGGQISS
jgi:hypothetical protein